VHDDEPLVRVPLELQLWPQGRACVWRAQVRAAQGDGCGSVSLDELCWPFSRCWRASMRHHTAFAERGATRDQRAVNAIGSKWPSHPPEGDRA
jgi:hypothetical protein